MKTLRVIGTFVFLGVLLLVFFSTRFEPLPKGSKAPLPEQLTLLSGATLDVASFKGKPLVINFWATWCPPCRAELPALVRAANRFKDSVNFAGIAADSPVQDLLAFQQKFQISYPIVLGGVNLLRAWKVEQFPVTYFVSATGEIYASHLGAISEDEVSEIVLAMLR